MHEYKVISSPRRDVSPKCTYIPKNRASRYMKQKLIECKEEKDKSTVMIGDFNSALSVIDGPRRRKVKIDKY